MRTPAPWSLITLPNGDQIVGNEEQKLCVCLAPAFPLHNAVAAWPDNAELIVRAPELERQLAEAQAHVQAFQAALRSLFWVGDIADLIEQRVQIYLPKGHPYKGTGT